MRAADNPFRTGRLDLLEFRPQGTTWSDLMSRLNSLKYRGAFVGPEGRGKTAALDSLACRLAREGKNVIRIRVETRARWLSRELRQTLPTSLGSGDAVLVDSAEQLNGVSWYYLRWLVRRAGVFVVATHRPGRLPTLLTCETSVTLLQDLVADLVTPETPLDSEVLSDFYSRHKGNVRLALLDLYDQWAEKPAPIGS